MRCACAQPARDLALSVEFAPPPRRQFLKARHGDIALRAHGRAIIVW
jgi:hypothetical protein